MKEHCSECGEQLQGNGSITNRYECSCGDWTPKLDDDFCFTGEYALIFKKRKK